MCTVSTWVTGRHPELKNRLVFAVAVSVRGRVGGALLMQLFVSTFCSGLWCTGGGVQHGTGRLLWYVRSRPRPVCPMSLVWLELEELMKGWSGVALTQFSSSSSSKSEAADSGAGP